MKIMDITPILTNLEGVHAVCTSVHHMNIYANLSKSVYVFTRRSKTCDMP